MAGRTMGMDDRCHVAIERHGIVLRFARRFASGQRQRDDSDSGNEDQTCRHVYFTSSM